MHTPVLLKSVLENLLIKKDGLYIDATAGEGGYIKEIIKKKGRVLAIDWDKNQVEKLKKQFTNKVKIILGNFADIEQIVKENDFHRVDGIIFDLGLSMDQLNKSDKGFSYKNLDEELDMRISDQLDKKANDLINKLSFEELYRVFVKNAEEIYSKEIAKTIVSERKYKKIIFVKDLIKIIDKSLKEKKINKEKVYRRVFQALRIEVNHEFENLRRGLEGSLNILKKTGRILVISFHSLEDRIVKNFIKEKELKEVLKKPITGTQRFERSAKLRIFGF